MRYTNPDGPRIYREISHELKIDRQYSGERYIVTQLAWDPLPERSLARVRAQQQLEKSKPRLLTFVPDRVMA